MNGDFEGLLFMKQLLWRISKIVCLIVFEADLSFAEFLDTVLARV